MTARQFPEILRSAAVLLTAAVCLAWTSVCFGAAPEAKTQLGKNVQTLATEYEKRGRFSGVVLVATDANVDLVQSFGLSSRFPEFSNAPDTCFKIGGITRSFTAAAILQLVANSRLTLDDPLGKYFPEIKGKPIEKITVLQLLTHTSGLPDYLRTWQQAWDMKLGENTPPRDGVDGVVRTILKDQPTFTPGSRFEYSNSAYMLLGQIVERLRGEPYVVWLRKFLDSIGLTHTGIDIEHEVSDSLRAVGYEAFLPFDPRLLFSRNKRRPIEYRNPEWDLSTSAMYSNANDLMRWLEFLESDQFLPIEGRAPMFARHARISGSTSIGLGWEILDHQGSTIHAQTGAARGFYSIVLRNPARKSTIIMLSNFGENASFRAKLMNDLVTVLSR